MIPVDIPPYVERRQINAALADVRDNAEVPQMIQWLQEFTEALKTNEPIGPIIGRYTGKLIPLLEELAGEEFQANEPLGYDDRPLRQLLDKLLDPRSLLYTDEIDQAFGHLQREVLSQQDQKIQRIMARNRQREKNILHEVREMRQEFAGVTDEILAEFAMLRVEDKEAVQQDLQAVEALKQKDAQQVEIIKHAIKEREIAIEALKERNVQLQEGLKITNGRITDTERSNAQLKIAINEAEQAMNEKQKSWLEAALMIGVAIGLSWIAPQLLPGLSASVGAGTAKSTVPAFFVRFSIPL